MLLAAGTGLALLEQAQRAWDLGDEEARAMGVETTRVRLAVIASATLMTAAAVSISGIIGWIGLVVPHAARIAAIQPRPALNAARSAVGVCVCNEVMLVHFLLR